MMAPDKIQALQGIPTVRPTGDRWSDLLTLVWARLLIATLALPVGVLLRPADPSAWWVLWWSLLAVGAASTLFWLGVRIRRGAALQSHLQVATDLALVTAISALRGSQRSPPFASAAVSALGSGSKTRWDATSSLPTPR